MKFMDYVSMVFFTILSWVLVALAVYGGFKVYEDYFVG